SIARICHRCGEVDCRMKRYSNNHLFLVTQHSSLGTVSLLFLASTVFAATRPAKAESQRDQTAAPAVLQSPAPNQGLNFSVGNRGLKSLSFNGQSLLGSPQGGELQPWKSIF